MSTANPTQSPSDDRDNEETRAAEAGEPIVVRDPKKVDVLFGRGQRISNHPGNKKYREIIEKYANEYAGKHKYKNKIAKAVLTEVLSYNGRFLRKKIVTNEINNVEEVVGWQPISNEDAVLEKIKQNFRDHLATVENAKRKEESDTWREEHGAIALQRPEQSPPARDQRVISSELVQSSDIRGQSLPTNQEPAYIVAPNDAAQQQRSPIVYQGPQDSQSSRVGGQSILPGSAMSGLHQEMSPAMIQYLQEQEYIRQQQALQVAVFPPVITQQLRVSPSAVASLPSSAVESSLDQRLVLLANLSNEQRVERWPNIGENQNRVVLSVPVGREQAIDNQASLDNQARRLSVSVLNNAAPMMTHEQQNLIQRPAHSNSFNHPEYNMQQQVRPFVGFPSSVPIDAIQSSRSTNSTHSLAALQLQMAQQQALEQRLLNSTVTTYGAGSNTGAIENNDNNSTSISRQMPDRPERSKRARKQD